MEYRNVEDKELLDYLKKEEIRQIETIELIASENFTSQGVMELTGSILTNKYAEGYPNRRYYGGCTNVDEIEQLAIDRVKSLYGAEHANVQPHCGTAANVAVYNAVLKPGDTVLGMKLNHGGHLSHGSSVSVTGQLYNFVHYSVTKQEVIDYEEMNELAKLHKPKLIVAGYSNYSREIDFERIAKIAKDNNALLMVDMAHIAGLIAAGVHSNPTPYADFVTSTTHKTLRGPRGGLILCKAEYASIIDKAIFPATQGGPLCHVIAAKAYAFKQASSEEFVEYQKQVKTNAKAMANQFIKNGYRIVSGGTDNHLFTVDLSSTKYNGAEVEKMLDECGITVNKNTIPFDTRKANEASGIRIGTPAITSRGYTEEDSVLIVDLIHLVISDFAENKNQVLTKVREITKKHAEGCDF